MRFQWKVMKVTMKLKCSSEGRRMGFWAKKWKQTMNVAENQ